MKTKLFVAAMASLMVFASCVKDIESASVTNVRNAKAAELTSIAAYNNAMAEAAVITANAEAALKAAQAEYQKAQAELVKAQAELLKVQTEEERTRLELLIVELETAKARSAAELERIAREMELELEKHKLDLFKAQQAYIEYAQQLEEAERARLIAVSGKYTKAVEELIDLQVEKVELEADIAALEAGITNAEEVLTRQIEATLSQIQYIDSQIENYKKYLAADQTELVNAIIDASFKKDQAAIAEADAMAVVNNSIDKVNEAWGKVGNGKYMEGFHNLYDYAFAKFPIDIIDGKYGYFKDDITFIPLFKYEEYRFQDVVYNGHEASIIEYTPAEVYTEGFTEFLDAKAAAANAKHELSVKKLTADKESAQADADDLKKRMDAAYPESLQKEIKEAYDKATEKIAEAETAAQKAEDAFNLAAMTVDFNESVELTNTLKAYIAAQNEYNDCKKVLDDMPGEINNEKWNIEYYKSEVGKSQSKIDNILKPAKEEADSLVDVYTAKVDSVGKVIAAFKLEEKEAAAQKAYYEWQAHLYDKDAAEYQKKYEDAKKAAEDVINDTKFKNAKDDKVNFQNQLDYNYIPAAEQAKTNLEDEEDRKVGLNEELDSCSTKLAEDEAALAKAELEIEGLESKLKLAEEAYEKAVAAYPDLYEMYLACLAANDKVTELIAERDAIAVYRTATVCHMSEKGCRLEDCGEYRDIDFNMVNSGIKILLPGNNLWDDYARNSYTNAIYNHSRDLAYVEGNEKGLELEEKASDAEFSKINDELSTVKACGELWDSYLNDIDSAKAAQEEYVTDWKAWVDAKIAYTDADAECTALGEILDHDSDIQEKIDALNEVEDALVEEIYDMIDVLDDASKTLYLMKAKQLPVLEAKIAAQEKLVEALEAELKALLGE